MSIDRESEGGTAGNFLCPIQPPHAVACDIRAVKNRVDYAAGLAALQEKRQEMADTNPVSATNRKNMIEQPKKNARILIVDDDQAIRESLEAILEDDYEVETATSGREGLQKLENAVYDLVLLDLVMPGIDGIEVLRRIKQFDRQLDVVMVSATDKARQAIDAIKSGAYDYVTKPFDPDAISNIVVRILEKRAMEKELSYLRSEVAKMGGVEIITQAESMKNALNVLDKVAGTTSSVLITGESGTGKELVARAVHNKSQRAQKPFVAINCASIPSELIESELFGYERGAFTGAVKRTIGKFEYAHEGTVFLDEIASLKPELQAQLLRFLQEREITRVGSNRTIKVDVRVIAATNTRLEDMVREGSFREDLFFRLNVIPIELPPLRRRCGDVPLLAQHFLEKFNRQLNRNILGLASEALQVLEHYPWPGNVRELENFIERMVVLGTDGTRIEEKDLPLDLLFHDTLRCSQQQSLEKGLLDARNNFERHYILRTLRSCNWNQADAARQLKVHRNTLLNKMKSLHIGTEHQNR